MRMSSNPRGKNPLRRIGIATLLFCPWLAFAADGLQSALQSTLVRNPEVKSKLAELESLGYKIDEAEAGRLPTLSVEARTIDDSSNKGLARVQQPLWTFGRISGSIALAERRRDVARFELLDLHRRLIEETAAVYQQSWSLRQRIRVAEANVGEHQSLYQMIGRRRQGGVASDADVRLAASRLTQARSQLDLLNAQLRKALQDLYALTRIEIPAQQPVEDQALAIGAPASLAATLETNYAKLRVQQGRLELIQAEGELQRAELKPTISARIDHDIRPVSNSQVSHTRAGIVFESRLEGGGLAGYKRLKSEAARLNAAMEDIDAARKEAQRRLDNLQVEMAAQKQNTDAQTTVVGAVDETLQSFLRQYDAGRKSWIDVLNTQRELADARQQLEQARAAWLDAALRTAAMLGHLDALAGMENAR
jgi:adhesin transport system outer membrane protein